MGMYLLPVDDDFTCNSQMRIRIYDAGRERRSRVRCVSATISSSLLAPGQTADPTHHADEQPRLLCCAANTCVANDADGEASSETSKPDRQTCTELDEASVERHGRLDWWVVGM